MFAVVTLGTVTITVGKYVLSPLLPNIIESLAITSFQAGVALSMMSVVFALAQYPGGHLSDQLSRKTILVTGVSVVCVGVAVLLGTHSYLFFVVGAMGIGIGRGLYSTASRALLSELFVERRGQAFGVNMASIDVSGAAAAGLAVAVVLVSVWQLIFLPILVLLFPILFFLNRWSDESLVLRRVPFDFWRTSQRIYRTTEIRRLLIAYSLFVFTIRGVLGFLPTYLQAEQGVSTGVASTAFATLFAVGLITKPLAGDLSDRMPRPMIGAGVLVIGAIGMGVIVTASSLATLFIGVGIYAVGQKAFGPVMQAYLMDVFPDDSMGGDLGAIRTVYMLVGSIGPAYVGYVANQLSYTVAFAGFAVSFLLAGGIVLSITYHE